MHRHPIRIALIILGMFLCLSALASVSRADCPCSSECGCGCVQGGDCSCSVASKACSEGGLKKDRFLIRLRAWPRKVIVKAHVRRQERVGFGWNPRFRPQRRFGG